LVVLDPHWLADLTATLVNGKVPFTNGRTSQADLVKAWPSVPASMHSTVISLLQNFELIIPQVQDPTSFIVPVSFPAEEPADFTSAVEKFKKTKLKNLRKLVREFSFEFLPLGFLPRLFCRVIHNTNAKIETSWKSGLLIEERDAYCECAKERVLIEYNQDKHNLTITAIQPNPGFVKIQKVFLKKKNLIYYCNLANLSLKERICSLM